MALQQYTRSKGRRFTYDIEYADDEYFISRDGQLKKSVADGVVAGVTPHEAKADLMLRMAISDIENLDGMEE